VRKLFVSLAVLLVLGVLAAGGIGWYFSGLVVQVQPTVYPIRVDAVDASTVTLSREPDDGNPGRYAIDWPSGHVRLGAIVRSDRHTVTRTITAVDRGRLTPGLKVRWDPYVFDGDPRSARGLDFAAVTYTSDAGVMPAWYVPGTGDTWVVVVHGRSGNRKAALRSLPALHRAGYPVLVPAYRNDDGAPAADGRQYHIGDTEWRDVDAAMHWAQARGARRFVLYGESMGGSIVLQAADRSPLAGQVAALVLDSPAVDWRNILDFHAGAQHLPTPLTRLAEWLVERRAHLSLHRLDWAARARDLRRPALIFHGPDDTYVPWQPSRVLAAARPDLVQLDRVDHADHVQSWNVDPERYDRDLLAFLARRAPVHSVGPAR
jgi:pimeloyl-ACP methyl ester carboxylesterase